MHERSAPRSNPPSDSPEPPGCLDEAYPLELLQPWFFASHMVWWLAEAVRVEAGGSSRKARTRRG